MDKKSKKIVLGRGLNSLLDDSNNKTDSIIENKITKNISMIGKTIEIDIDKITLNPMQPRTRFNKESLNELALSIKNFGVIQPITVFEKSKNNFELISGERRVRASKLIQLKKISAFVKDVKDSEKLEMALVENIQREDLDPIEIAITYNRLIKEINITHEKLSDRVGKKRSTISNYLRLLKLDPIIQSGLRDGFIAHEVSPVIPHCVSGEKDAVKDNGKMQTQTMEYSQLTPLLTAALQEAIAEIETLKADVAALKSS